MFEFLIIANSDTGDCARSPGIVFWGDQLWRIHPAEMATGDYSVLSHEIELML
jgi:hypothetical protein